MQVYANLQPQAYFLHLADDGAGLQAAWAAFSRMQDAIGVLNWYYALNGISILLLIARWVGGQQHGQGDSFAVPASVPVCSTPAVSCRCCKAGSTEIGLNWYRALNDQHLAAQCKVVARTYIGGRQHGQGGSLVVLAAAAACLPSAVLAAAAVSCTCCIAVSTSACASMHGQLPQCFWLQRFGKRESRPRRCSNLISSESPW